METPAIVNNVRDFFVVEVPKKWNGLSPLNQKVVMAVAALFVALAATVMVCSRKHRGTKPFTPSKPKEVGLPADLANTCMLVRQGNKVAKDTLETDLRMGQIKDPTHVAAAEEALAKFGTEKLGSF